MFRKLVGIALATILVSSAAAAQILEPRRLSRDPAAWSSLSIGWFSQQGFCHEASASCWDFGSAAQWRASLEFPVGRGATLGAAATIARPPMVYVGNAGPNSCVRCDADAQIVQYLANLRIGGGSGFHQVIDLSLGKTAFSSFRTTDGARIGPEKSVSNWSFAVGYGFGYTVSPRFHLMLLQEYGVVVHERVSGNADNTAQQSTLRLGARVGLGDAR